MHKGESMKGVYVVGGHQVGIKEMPKPEPQFGQVVVRTVEAGVCGSDLHGYRADPRPNPKGLVAGHELTGIVEAIGPGVESVRPGDRVVAYQAWGCGYCGHCTSGHANLCSNRKIIGKADRYQKEYALMPEGVALPLPDGMSFDDGIVLSCAGGTAWAGLQKVSPSCEDTVVVFGLGPVGLMGVFWARAMGAHVIGVEVVPERLELGLHIGAHTVIDATTEDPVERVMELTDGYGATVGYEGSGNKDAQRMVLEATHWSARVVYVAIGRPGPVIDPRTARSRGAFLGLRAIHGTFTYSMQDWHRMTRTIVLHGLEPGQIVTHRFAIEDAQDAYAIADSGHCGKVVFQLS